MFQAKAAGILRPVLGGVFEGGAPGPFTIEELP